LAKDFEKATIRSSQKVTASLYFFHCPQYDYSSSYTSRHSPLVWMACHSPVGQLACFAVDGESKKCLLSSAKDVSEKSVLW
jgi:hypothetical protein